MDWLTLALRWLHFLAGAAVVGGLLFQGLAWLPAVRQLPEADREKLGAAIGRGWSKVVMLAAVVLLGTGLFNMLRYATAYDLSGTKYHMLFGIKFLLALGLLFIVSALAGRSAGLAKIRANARQWVLLGIVLSLIVAGVSSSLRIIRDNAPKKTPVTAVEKAA